MTVLKNEEVKIFEFSQEMRKNKEGNPINILTLNQDHVTKYHADGWHVTEKNYVKEDYVDGWHVTGIITAKDHDDRYYV